MYGDKIGFGVGEVKTATYSDGTEVPRLLVTVTRNGAPVGTVEVHAHRTKDAPHISIGTTVRVGEGGVAWRR